MDFFSWMSLISGVSALLLNIFLIPIILKYSSKNIGKYKYLLLLYTITAIFYSAAQVCLLPTFFLFSTGYIFYSTVNYVPRVAGNIAIVVFPSMFASLEVVICLSFLYRYGVLSSPRVLNCFKLTHGLPFTVIIAIVTALLPSLSILGITENSLVNKCFREESLEKLKMNPEDYVYIGSPLFLGSTPYWPGLAVAICYSSITIGTVTIECYCISRMVKFFGLVESSSSIKVQKRLFILLILQALFPFIFNGTPVILIYTCSYLNITAGIIPQLFGALMSIAQLVDPVLVLSFIGEYRRAVFQLIGLKNLVNKVKYASKVPQNASPRNEEGI